MKNKKGLAFIACGLLLIAAALALVLYNIQIQKAAGNASRQVLQHLKDSDVFSTFPDAALVPDYVLNPNMDMPEKEIDGSLYIAMLTIPSLGVELPVNTKWSYSDLNTAPCRYSGSAYTGNLIICAHNFNVHFESIKYLKAGDKVMLKDMDGNEFCYEVIGTEILDSNAVEQLESGKWDLTLFTCTVDGAKRVTIRCGLI